MKVLAGHWTIKLGIFTTDRNKSFQSLFFCTHTTALWPVEQSSILYAKFDCPVARQNFYLYLLRMIVKLAYRKFRMSLVFVVSGLVHCCHDSVSINSPAVPIIPFRFDIRELK